MTMQCALQPHRGTVLLSRPPLHSRLSHQKLPALLLCRAPTCCTSGFRNTRPAETPQHRRHEHFTTARQQRRHTKAAATALLASAASTSDVHPDILSVVYDGQQLAEAVSELGRQLAEEYEEKQPLLLGALTGAFVFMADLARSMTPVPAGMTVDFFAVSSYGAATVASDDVNVNMAAAKIDVTGRHVLVVEDIIDTGATLKRVVARLHEAGAASVKVVVLLDKAARRKVDIQPDYCALACPDEFVVGYGLDFNEVYRSLPYVGVLRPELYT